MEPSTNNLPIQPYNSAPDSPPQPFVASPEQQPAPVSPQPVVNAPQEVNPNPSPVVNSVVSAIDSDLKSKNIPNSIGRWHDMKGLIFASFLIIAGIIGGIIIKNQHQTKAALAVFGFVSGVGLIVFLISFISYRQLSRSARQPETYNQFQTDTAVQYNTPISKAGLSADETIGSWLGPVNRTDKGGISYTLVSKEVDNQAINTLVFTSKQVIGLMIAPQDLPAANGGVLAAAGALANEAVKYSADGAEQKDLQFEMLNSRHWEDMVNQLSAQPLQSVLDSHLNFGLAYNSIASIEVKNSIVNSGLVFHLKDNSKLTYSTMLKSQITPAAQYLRQYISFQ
jgi:hypothetical protein